MAYKMKNGTGPNALPLLALIPPAIAAAKGLIGAGVVAGGAKAAAAGAAIAKAAGTVGGAVGGAAKAVGGGIAGAAGKVGGAAGKEGFKALVKDAGKGTLISTLAQAPVTAKQKIEENQALKQQEQALFKSKFSPSMMGDVKGPNMEKSRKRVAQDYARNAIADRKAGRTREILQVAPIYCQRERQETQGNTGCQGGNSRPQGAYQARSRHPFPIRRRN